MDLEPLEPLELLTEEILREAIGSEIVDRAFVDLANGKVIKRVQRPENQIAARWDYQPNAPEMQVGFQDDMLLTLCTCRPFRQEGMCAHVAGLLIAWVSQRATFNAMPNEIAAPGMMPAREAAPRPAPAGQGFDVVENFRQILNRLTVGELRVVARRRNIALAGIRKEPIVDSLAQAFSQKERFRQDWQLLSAPARRLAGLLPFLIHYCNTVSLEQAAQALGIKGLAFTEALDDLKTFGMIAVESFGAIHYPAVLPVWAPPDADFMDVPVMDPHALRVQALRVQAAPAPESFYRAVTRLLVLIQAAPDHYQARIDAQTRDILKKVPLLRDWPIELQDLERVVQDPRPYQFIQQHGLRMAPSPSPLTNEARHKLSAAVQAAPEMIDFITRMLQAMKLLKITPGKPVQAVPGAMAAILQAGAMQQARQLFVGYADLQGWSEIDLALAQSSDFRLILRNYNQGNYNLFVQNLSALRERLILLIRRLPAGEWYAVRDLVRNASLFPFYSLLRGLAGFGYFEVNGRKVNIERLEDGQELLSRLIEAMLYGPLYWQGAVDLAWEKDRLAGFRFTDLGSALLAQPVDFEMPKPEQDVPALEFTTDGNLALQLEGASGDLIGLAMLLGDVEVSTEGAVFVRPTLLGAGRAFEAGWSAGRILDTLASEAGLAAPAVLADRLRKWWQDFGRVQIYQDVALMEFNDDHALGELLAGTSLSRYLLYRFSPRLIAIRPEGAEELRGELVKKGYTPKTSA